MSRFARALGATLGVVLLGLIFTLAPQKNASGAPGATNVVVTNTPLPVTGSVSVANTPLPVSGGVSITNTPLPILGNVNASQNGTWTVGVNNLPASQSVSFNGVTQPVSFSNSLTQPIFNRDVDNGKNPFAATLAFNNSAPPGAGCNNASACQASYTVPAGKRFVIEQVSALVEGAPGQNYLVIVSGDSSMYLVLNPQGQVSGFSPPLPPTLDIFVASQPMRIYADAGSTPSPGAEISSSSGQSFIGSVNISGYLVDQ